jgi:hypothetical protein
MKYLLSLLLVIAGLQAFSQDPFLVPQNADAFYNRAYPSVNKKYRSLTEQTVKAFKGKEVIADSSIRQNLHGRASLDKLTALDIDALVVFVLVQTSKDEIAEMKGLMAEIKKNNMAKKEQRTKPSRPATSEAQKEQAVRDAAKDGGFANSPQKQLEKLMEHRNQVNQLISSLMEKVGAAQDDIIKKLKS